MWILWCFSTLLYSSWQLKQIRPFSFDLYHKHNISTHITVSHTMLFFCVKWVLHVHFPEDQECLKSSSSGPNNRTTVKGTKLTLSLFWCLLETLTEALDLCLHGFMHHAAAMWLADGRKNNFFVPVWFWYYQNKKWTENHSKSKKQTRSCQMSNFFNLTLMTWPSLMGKVCARALHTLVTCWFESWRHLKFIPFWSIWCNYKHDDRSDIVFL